ncbi:MAG TPA: hypothetical protein DIW44_12665 [Anaerolineaceae bacterium]|nr:hypothetical protein [Anaerolineaceae bacterium]
MVLKKDDLLCDLAVVAPPSAASGVAASLALAAWASVREIFFRNNISSCLFRDNFPCMRLDIMVK